MSLPDFKVRSNPQGATPRYCAIASATVIEEGDAVTLSSGLLTKAVAASTSAGIAAAASADGETADVPVYNDPSIVFEGTADANFAATHRGTEVDLVGTTNQLIDVGASATDVFKIEPGTDAGTVGSTASVLFTLNKPI